MTHVAHVLLSGKERDTGQRGKGAVGLRGNRLPFWLAQKGEAKEEGQGTGWACACGLLGCLPSLIFIS